MQCSRWTLHITITVGVEQDEVGHHGIPEKETKKPSGIFRNLKRGLWWEGVHFSSGEHFQAFKFSIFLHSILVQKVFFFTPKGGTCKPLP